MEHFLEVECAAKWWADQLRQSPTHDNGDGFQSALLALVSNREPLLSEAQIALFEQILANKLQVQVDRSDWNPEKPELGGAWRMVSVDYDPCPVLYDAAERVGIDVGYRFPIKTHMWIDPGSVKVAVGYGAREREIYAITEKE